MLIAKGSADLYFRYTPTVEWDIAVSQIILEEADGTLKNILTDKSIKYNNKEVLVNVGFIVKG